MDCWQSKGKDSFSLGLSSVVASVGLLRRCLSVIAITLCRTLIDRVRMRFLNEAFDLRYLNVSENKLMENLYHVISKQFNQLH